MEVEVRVKAVALPKEREVVEQPLVITEDELDLILLEEGVLDVVLNEVGQKVPLLLELNAVSDNSKDLGKVPCFGGPCEPRLVHLDSSHSVVHHRSILAMVGWRWRWGLSSHKILYVHVRRKRSRSFTVTRCT